ncbi:DinB family protein [Pedobacter chinensis]|uniref:DinB family protein n=1 Tax=Pedobacter chinensis TaxID=2282421 RepID=A0A369PZY6_9SPHI|nr:DinB family protein [Pedobacter chinensis]RDC58203.1 DinB family protein [Pedobacter chinensis]
MEKPLKDLTPALSKFEALFNDFESSKINAIPFEGSWTAGQLIQHMLLSNSGFVEMINGPVEETNRPADLMIERIKKDFLNFDIKMESPDFICPEAKNYDKNELLQKLDRVKRDITDEVTHLDLTKTCTSFELPVYGFLTRLEAIYFVIYHTQRHTKQLENIYSKLA